MRTTTTRKHSNTDSKTSPIDVDYIKIPKDFKSLHELKELVNNYGLVRRFVAALNDYQKLYVDSYLMTAEEVLAYIPVVQYDEYSVRVREKDLRKYVTYRFGEKSPIYQSLDNYLSSVDVQKDDKVFLVDTVNKFVDACFWAIDPTVFDERAKVQLNGPAKLLLGEGTFRKQVPDVQYTGGASYDVDENKELLYVYASYKYSKTRVEGGVTINSGCWNAYKSGGKHVTYTAYGKSCYVFCTRTNKYLGYHDISR